MIRLLRITSAALLLFYLRPAHAAWTEVPLANLDVTEGQADATRLSSGLIDITGPRFRATERNFNTYSARLSFEYRGEAPNGSPTEGGDYRIQIGEKLIAANPCNLVYVIWRIQPTESLVVSVKRYPGTTSAECGNRVYTNVVPDTYPAGATTSSIAIPSSLSARTGTTRTLTSGFNPRTRILSAYIDGHLVWQGHMPWLLVRRLTGPSGIRTDNGLFRFRFYTNK